jgi:hypothetical protein
MPPPSKFKKKLQAQAALARSSRSSLAQSATPSESIPTSPSSPTVSITPDPSNIPDAVFDEESNLNQGRETFENDVCLHLPDTHEGPEEDRYHTDEAKLRMQCKKPECDPDGIDCCAKRIIDLQPDFKEQKSLVHETIEAAGHRCIMLPKYHCELNEIEFFWGAMKRYLREHCDYTYSGLQKNIPDAMASINVLTIRKWEHRMIRWMDAYRDGKGTKEAQIQVKKFGSRKQTSHRRVYETVARAFD